MNGNERRQKIISILNSSDSPIMASELAAEFSVSRQVIVQDIALIRSKGMDIIATRRGYFVNGTAQYSRVFKVIHSDDEVEEELKLIVDLGGHVEDVFIYHKLYDIVRAKMNIRSRRDIEHYINEIRSGRSSLLKNVTSGYHYHTITAESEEVLDIINDELGKRGFLAELKEYEPEELGRN